MNTTPLEKKNGATKRDVPAALFDGDGDVPAPKPKPKTSSSKASKNDDKIFIPPMKIHRMVVHVKGLTELIVHAWSVKAKAEMRDTQTGKAKPPRGQKNPVAEFEAAKYKVGNQDCVPSQAFKSAIVSSARFSEGTKMTVLRGAIFIEGEYLPIQFKECRMREDMVKVGGFGSGKADLRYRPGYIDWSVNLPIQYNADVVTAEQILNLIAHAGFSIGICEWRPDKNGSYGRFEPGGIIP